MSVRLSILFLVAGVLLSTAAPAQPAASPAPPTSPPSPREGLLVLVDHAATSAEAADVCEQRLPGSGSAIRDAHARWQGQHGVAQDQLLDLMLQELQAKATARGETGRNFKDVLPLLRQASLDKLRSAMRAMETQRLTQFCADYPGEFDKPAMDFMALWLRTQSRR